MHKNTAFFFDILIKNDIIKIYVQKILRGEKICFIRFLQEQVVIRMHS